MRSIGFFSVVAVLAVTSLAWAQASLSELAPYPGDPLSTEANSITPDGQWIVGNSGGGENRGVLWNAASPSAPINVLGGSMQAGYLRGIAYRTEPVGSRQELVMFGKTSNTVGPTWWFYRPSDGTWGPKLRETNAANNMPASNALASHITQADAVFTTWWKVSSAQVQVGVLAGGTDTTAPTIVYDQKSTTEESNPQAVSRTGRAVGWRKVSTVPNNYVTDYVDDGTAGNLAVAYYPGLAGTNLGQGEAISADGTIVCGYSPVSGGRTGNWPYKAVLDANRTLASIVELPSLDPAAVSNQGIVYGMTADGHYGVGRDYSLGADHAVLWDLQALSVTDLTAEAAKWGVLGSFDAGNGLRRAYSVGVDAAQRLCIVGAGNTSAGPRGFLLVLTPSSALPCAIPFADMDTDGDVDSADFGAFQICYTGTVLPTPPLSTRCKCLDRIQDVGKGMINTDDLTAFLNCFTGPGILYKDALPPNCVPGNGYLP